MTTTVLDPNSRTTRYIGAGFLWPGVIAVVLVTMGHIITGGVPGTQPPKDVSGFIQAVSGVWLFLLIWPIGLTAFVWGSWFHWADDGDAVAKLFFRVSLILSSVMWMVLFI